MFPDLAIRTALAFGVLLLAASSAFARPTPPRPHLVLVLADDLGWGDLGCYNRDSKIPTPHLDRLASQGLRFLDAHSPSAVCTPTRYGLLTGRYAWRSRLRQGVLWGYSPPLIETHRLTLPGFLHSAGYRTACVGKWHLGLDFATHAPARFGDHTQPDADVGLVDWSRPLRSGPLNLGFDRFFGIPASLDMVPYVYVDGDRVVSPPTAQLAGDRSQRQGGGGFWRGGPGSPDFAVEDCLPKLTERALAFLQEATEAKPLFLYFPLTAPHDPWVPTAEFKGRSAAGPRGDFVAQVDATVGQLLRTLDERGLTDETLFVFTSDNGAHWLPAEVQDTGHAANGPWRGMKSDAYEGGHRVPFIVRWPGHVRPGTTSRALIGLQDVFATVAELLGRPIPPGVAEDSVSFVAALRGSATRRPTPLVLHSVRGTFALRDGPWKWIDAADSGGWTQGKTESTSQLYHLGRDPGETRNLAEARPDKVRSMRSKLERLRNVP